MPSTIFLHAERDPERSGGERSKDARSRYSAGVPCRRGFTKLHFIEEEKGASGNSRWQERKHMANEKVAAVAITRPASVEEHDRKGSSGPELFIGIVGAVGTNVSLVIDYVVQELRAADYHPELIRMSAMIASCAKYKHLGELDGGPEDDRINRYMDAGDDLRRTMKRGDAAALLAITKIQTIRIDRTGSASSAVPRTAYIFNSLKHPDEVNTLRAIYGQAFFVVSAYTPREVRLSQLCDLLSRSRKDYQTIQYEDAAKKLNERDEQEVGDDYGQSVRETFPLGDVFVDASDADALHRQLKRFISILFSYPYATPTVDEYGMFHARAAALRSADLSRQVGAVITSLTGELIAAGCNEVPSAGGGAIWEDAPDQKTHDYRDFKKGYDATARMQREMVTEILERLGQAGWLGDECRNIDPVDLANKALYEGLVGKEPPLRGTRAAGTLEFGRMVHAEMFAITEAARRGMAVKDALLYCTTFPCHMCARHIIAAGIKGVVYIEPYPKSLAKQLYPRSIRVDRDSEADPNAVDFRPFVGIAPRRYLELFAMVQRKDRRGHTIQWSAATAQTRFKQSPVFGDLEVAYLTYLAEHKAVLGLG